MYQNPRHADANCTLSDEELQKDFDDFFEDFFCELARYGTLIEMHVCDNVGEHLIGNVYARYEFEEEAGRAVDALNERWYAGESRSDWRRLRQVSAGFGGCPASMKLPLSLTIQSLASWIRSPSLLRTLARYGLQGSLLPPE